MPFFAEKIALWLDNMIWLEAAPYDEVIIWRSHIWPKYDFIIWKTLKSGVIWHTNDMGKHICVMYRDFASNVTAFRSWFLGTSGLWHTLFSSSHASFVHFSTLWHAIWFPANKALAMGPIIWYDFRMIWYAFFTKVGQCHKYDMICYDFVIFSFAHA